MSDRTRTHDESTGRKPDVGLDGIGRQLFVLARVGLSPGKILERQQTDQALGMVLDLALPGGNLRDKVMALIRLVVEAAPALGNGPVGESIRKLYGTDPGERGLPYQRRHAAAAAAWDPDIEIASYDRRYRRTCINALEQQMLEIKREEERQALQDAVSRQLPPPANPSEDKPNLEFKRLAFTAESHILAGSRHPGYTDWHYHDLALTGRQQYFRVYTQVEARLEIEPLDDFVVVERVLGTNRFGYQAWLLRFRTMPEQGQDFTWGIRKRFLPPWSEPADRDWLSLAVSQPNHIGRGTFIVDLTEADEMPKRFARFITPKMTLPNLRGQTWPVSETESLRKTAKFEHLTPWHSHGIYWWWHL